MLARNEQFSQEELSIASEFQSKFHKAAKTVISFYEVDFSYDQKFLIQVILHKFILNIHYWWYSSYVISFLQLLTECKNLLKQIVQPHLTEKSLGRIDLVFGFFSNPVFLDMVFKKNSEYNEIMTKIISDMHSALEQGEL